MEKIPVEAAPKRPVCENPIWVINGKPVLEGRDGAMAISCTRCEKCALTRKAMLVGKMAAQYSSSQHTIFLTLTYANAVDTVVPDFTPTFTVADWGSQARALELYNGQTYCPWPDGSKTLIREHVEKFRKSMTKRYGKAGKMEYVIAGEYGARKHRAHWHVVLYFPKGVPLPKWVNIPKQAGFQYRLHRHSESFEFDASMPGCKRQDEQFVSLERTVVKGVERFRVLNFPGWPWGHVDIADIDGGTFDYIAKYLLKDKHLKHVERNSTRTQSASIISRGLGMEYIAGYGKEYAVRGGEPSASRYSVGGFVYRRGEKKGKPLKFPMSASMRREFIWGYLREKAAQLRRKEIKQYKCGGPYLASFLNKDTRADHREDARSFQRKMLGRGKQKKIWLTELPITFPIGWCKGRILSIEEDANGKVYAVRYNDQLGGMAPTLRYAIELDRREIRIAEQYGLKTVLSDRDDNAIFPMQPRLLSNKGVRSIGLPLSYKGHRVSRKQAHNYPLFTKWMMEADK